MRQSPPYAIIVFAAVLVFSSVRAQDSLGQGKTRGIDSSQSKGAFIKRNSPAPNDSIGKIAHRLDTAILYQSKPLDSLQKKFHHRTDSLLKAYAAPMHHLHSSLAMLNHKKDSLAKLNLPTASVTHSIDSVEKAQTAKLNELNTRIAKVKSETLGKASSLHLPPEAQKELIAFTKNINGFKVPSNFFQLPKFKVPGLPYMSSLGINTSLKLPSNLSIPTTSIPSLQKLDIGSMKMPSLSQLEGSLGNDIKKLQSLTKAVDAKSLEKDAMNVAGQNSEVKSLLKDESQVKSMEKEFSQLQKAKNADSMALQQLKPAVNHFAGKEKELTAAMDKVSKLKQKYSSVKSLSDLPKRAPNPLKDKPWIERMVPGLNYFVQNRHYYTLVDFNPYIGWRFTPRLVVSVGWNERTGISHWNFHVNQYDRVSGVRTTASYLWTHGINFKIAPEVMNAYIPTNGSPDVRHRATVLGFYAGVRKDFPIYRSLKGYSEVMYNFTQKPYQNIYGDPVSFRFGMELKLKKKAKKNGVGMVNPSTLKNKAAHPSDSFHIVRKEKLFGVVGVKGDTVVPVSYERIKKFLGDGKLYFIVRKDKKFGALSSNGKESVPVSHPMPATVKFEIIDRVRNKYKLDGMMNVK